MCIDRLKGALNLCPEVLVELNTAAMSVRRCALELHAQPVDFSAQIGDFFLRRHV